MCISLRNLEVLHRSGHILLAAKPKHIHNTKLKISEDIVSLDLETFLEEFLRSLKVPLNLA